MTYELIAAEGFELPVWMAIVIGAAAFVMAVITLWNKAIKPGIKAASSADEMLPLLRELTRTFRDHPDAFSVLDQIASEFRTDSGSSLRDSINRLEASAMDNKNSSELLKVNIESARQLAQRDREQLQQLILVLDRLTVKVDGGNKSIDEIILDREKVADKLATAQGTVDEVAKDLHESHLRANEAVGPAGEAADAASRKEVLE